MARIEDLAQQAAKQFELGKEQGNLSTFISTLQGDLSMLNPQERKQFFAALKHQFQSDKAHGEKHVPQFEITGLAKANGQTAIAEKGGDGKTHVIDAKGKEVHAKEVHSKAETVDGKQFNIQADGKSAKYEIKHGDTLVSIAKAFLKLEHQKHGDKKEPTFLDIMAEIKKIAAANHITNINKILTGQTLTIPENAETQARPADARKKA